MTKTFLSNFPQKFELKQIPRNSSIALNENSPPQVQVFINFRGNDLRQNFVTHLETALKHYSVNLFAKQDELKGDDPIKFLSKRIEESKIALAIFSTKYTESSWCLDELVKIKEREEEGKLITIPIFYELNPSEVKRLEGDFGSNLWNQVKLTADFDKLKKWKEALDFVSHKTGFALTENG